VRRSRKQQAAHEAKDKFVFHGNWGDKGNEGIKQGWVMSYYQAFAICIIRKKCSVF